jgi:FKBP-type peptidyl-prolyl cis-trans isomerase FkpA
MRLSLVAAVTLTALGLSACQPKTLEQATDVDEAEVSTAGLETDAQKQAYALGASMGMYVNNRKADQIKYDIEFDQAALIRGFHDGIDDKVAFTRDELQAFARTADEELKAEMAAEANTAAAQNIASGEDYLAENAKKAGVITTESGLQYEVLVQGDGKQPTAEDTVKVHYRGTLLDGTEFDSSYARNEPAVFPLTRVISGWTEGVQLMAEGSKFRFHIKPELAYGERATGSITPNSTLIFDVELLEVVVTESN